MLSPARVTSVVAMSFLFVSAATSTLTAEQPPASAAANRAADAAPKEVSLAEGLTKRFNSAMKAFKAGRTIAAELDLRDAANLVEQQSKKAASESRKRLEATSSDLKQIAERVRNGKIATGQQLGKALARVHMGLAIHHTTECQHCLKHGGTTKPADRNRLAAGLDAGLFHFEEAARLAGRKLNKTARHGLLRSRDTVELLAEGSRDTVVDSGRAVSWLTRELKDMVREGRIGVGVGFEETDLAPSLLR